MARFPLPFRYPGGKHYAINTLEPFWLNVDHNEYREPFVGGGSIFFNKPKAKYNWLNDLDCELMETFKAMQDKARRGVLVKKLADEIASKERWREVFEFKTKTRDEVAYKYYYLNRTSFSGKLASAAWGYRPKRSLPPERWSERIIPSGEKLSDVKLTCQDFENVILDDSKRNVLLYVDPPYFNPPKNKHYRNGFDIIDHERLCKTLKKTPHRFFLTYDNNKIIKEMYSWAKVFDLNFYYRVGNSNSNNGQRKMGFELVITNYDLPNQELLIK